MMGCNRDGIRSCRRMAALLALVLAAGGCSESADQAEARRKKENNLPEQILIKFSGKVTIDGQPPQLEPNHKLLIFLFDPKAPPPHGHSPRLPSRRQRHPRVELTSRQSALADERDRDAFKLNCGIPVVSVLSPQSSIFTFGKKP
jgi:hypothetical protein